VTCACEVLTFSGRLSAQDLSGVLRRPLIFVCFFRVPSLPLTMMVWVRMPDPGSGELKRQLTKTPDRIFGESATLVVFFLMHFAYDVIENEY
jgi:hypothetical protein